MPNLLTISRSVRALSVCFASHFDFNYAHICRLRHKICLSFTMGLKFATQRIGRRIMAMAGNRETGPGTRARIQLHDQGPGPLTVPVCVWVCWLR